MNASKSKCCQEMKLWFEVKSNFMDQGVGLKTPHLRGIFFIEYANNNGKRRKKMTLATEKLSTNF